MTDGTNEEPSPETPQAARPAPGSARSVMPGLDARGRGGWRWPRKTALVAALVVLLVTGALAFTRASLTPPVYVASQAFAIIVTLPNAATTSSSYDESSAAQQAAAVAQFIVTPAFLGASAFTSDLATRLSSQPGDATTRAATSAQLAQALSGQPSAQGAQVTLTARWATAAGAQAIVAAATTALQFDGAQLIQQALAAANATSGVVAASATTTTTSPAVSLTPPLAVGASVGAQTLGAATIATRDAANDAATRRRLFEQLALALIAAGLLGVALDWALTRRPRQTHG